MKIAAAVLGYAALLTLGAYSIRRQIDRGVAWTMAPGDPHNALAEMQALYGDHLRIIQLNFDRSENY